MSISSMIEGVTRKYTEEEKLEIIRKKRERDLGWQQEKRRRAKIDRVVAKLQWFIFNRQERIMRLLLIEKGASQAEIDFYVTARKYNQPLIGGVRIRQRNFPQQKILGKSQVTTRIVDQMD